MQVPEAGDTDTFTRTFTREEVREFAALSGDEGTHHVEPDEDGRLLVHGLLTATLPTKIGGDYDVLAREMDFEFPRPVYTGEEITCRWRFEHVTERKSRYILSARAVCRDESGEVVLRAQVTGVIMK
ncbi:FAS1-like dehydratase domain-containing protein [Haloarchaeobius sp. DYHT-AS-18]|uniref:FAS1-like dehydratase domain-containing protein n=1 Tax=Haloarchaeobius sp. DYHT-AS-18 TaxID=3446117 RepID=UPI003EBEE62F